MNRTRKAALREALEYRLERAFKSLYHNATIGYATLPDDAEDFFDDDAQAEELAFYFDCALGEVNAKRENGTYFCYRDHISGHIAYDYGHVHTYGRGSRTCAPKSWIRSGGGSTFSIDMPEARDMSRRAILDLCIDVEAWNAYVAAECSSANVQRVLFDRYVELKAEADAEHREKVEALIRI